MNTWNSGTKHPTATTPATLYANVPNWASRSLNTQDRVRKITKSCKPKVSAENGFSADIDEKQPRLKVSSAEATMVLPLLSSVIKSLSFCHPTEGSPKRY